LPYLPLKIGLINNDLKELTILLELFLVVKVPNKILLRKSLTSFELLNDILS
jgi:hypothetical protein